MGARIITLVLSGNDSMASWISAGVCWLIGVPHFGQPTSPTRAISTRKKS